MAPKDAALALVETNSDAETKQKIRFVLDDADGAHPPDHGEIGLRWHCAHCYLAEEGLIILRQAGADSKLLYSAVKVFLDGVKPGSVERAVNQTKAISLPEQEVRHLYEVIWWLGHLSGSKATTSNEVERVISTGDGHGTFWISPQQRRTQVTLPTFTLNEQFANGFDKDTRASCADFLLSEALDKHDVDLHQPTATVGRDPSTYPERKFVLGTKPPDPHAAEETRRWVSRMLELLQNSRHITRSEVIGALVPDDEPRRFSDPRIDSALFHLFDRGFVRASSQQQNDSSRFWDAGDAAEALAARDRAEVFLRLMKVLRAEKKELCDWKAEALQAAVTLTARHPEFRGELSAYVQEQLVDLTKSAHAARNLFDAAWLTDLRELAPELEKLAASSPDEIVIRVRDRVEQGAAGRFHEARAVLTAWREQDSLTKLKLDAILGASSLTRTPEFLRAEYQALPGDQQSSFRGFLKWMETQKVFWGAWRPEKVKKVLDLL